MIITDQRNDADLVIRIDKVRITSIVAMAVCTLYTKEQPKVYAADVKTTLPNTINFNPKDGSRRSYGHVKAFFEAWAYFNLENAKYVVPYINDKFFDKIENKNPNVITIAEGINTLFKIYPVEEAYTKAIEIVVALLKNVITAAEEFSKIQLEMDEKLANPIDGCVIDVTTMKGDWRNAFWNSMVTHKVTFVFFKDTDGHYKFSSIPYCCEYGNVCEVIKKVPSEWLKLSIDEVRNITGADTLQMLEPRGFGGICGTREDAIKICNLIASIADSE